MDSSCEKKNNWAPKKYSLICSDHYEPSCFVVRAGKVRCRLYNNSVPTVFPSSPAYYPKEQRKRKLTMKWVYVLPQKFCEPSLSKVAKIVGSEHSYASITDSAHSEVKQLKKDSENFEAKSLRTKEKKMKIWKSL